MSRAEVRYGEGTAEAPCEDCAEVPTRHCCYFWQDEEEEATDDC